MNPTVIKLIKVISSLVITVALSLVGWNLSLNLHGEPFPANLSPLLWLGSLALFAHGVEGLIAAFQARSQAKNPLAYGVYTFFVGFVGLQELQQDN